MASYKQPCMQCGALIEREAQFCPFCGSSNAFGYHCPTCSKPVERGQLLCALCGRSLYIACPHCGETTFVQERCEICGEGLMLRCQNSRCGALQFFENKRCTACGKKIKGR